MTDWSTDWRTASLTACLPVYLTDWLFDLSISQSIDQTTDWFMSRATVVLSLTCSTLVCTSCWFHKHLFLDWLASSTWPTTLAVRHCTILRLMNVQQPLRKLGCSPGLPVHVLTHAQTSTRKIYLEFALLAFGGSWEAVSCTAKSYRVALGLSVLEVISVYKTRCWIDSDFVETEIQQRKNRVNFKILPTIVQILLFLIFGAAFLSDLQPWNLKILTKHLSLLWQNVAHPRWKNL